MSHFLICLFISIYRVRCNSLVSFQLKKVYGPKRPEIIQLFYATTESSLSRLLYTERSNKPLFSLQEVEWGL